MKKVSLIAFAMITAGTLVFTGCNKLAKEAANDSTTASDNANTQTAFDDAFKMSEDAMTSNNAGRIGAVQGPIVNINCGTVTIDSVTTPGTKYFTITFDSNCSGYDGKTRSGQIQVTLTGGRYTTPGSVATMVPVNYYVNGVKVEGKKVVTCVSSTEHNIVVSDAAGTGYATITYTDGKTAQWKSSRTRKRVSGTGLTNYVFEISGTNGDTKVAEGINKNGTHYIVNVESPIVVDFACLSAQTSKIPTKGIVTITPDNEKARKIDYGDGTCDNTIKVSVGKISKNITIQ